MLFASVLPLQTGAGIGAIVPPYIVRLRAVAPYAPTTVLPLMVRPSLPNWAVFAAGRLGQRDETAPPPAEQGVAFSVTL